jgi:hypothetical protein
MNHPRNSGGISPWTRIIPTTAKTVRVICLDRSTVDLGPQESAHVVAYCQRASHSRKPQGVNKPQAQSTGGLPPEQPTLTSAAVPPRSASATRGHQILTQLGQAEPETFRQDPGIKGLGQHPQLLVLCPDAWRSALVHTLSLVSQQLVVLSQYPDPEDLDPVLALATSAVLVGELDWSIARRLQQSGISHMLLSPGGSHVEASGWVHPGITPCLRCQYLCQRDADPFWSHVITALHDWPTPDPDELLVHASGLHAADALRRHWAGLTRPTQFPTRIGVSEAVASRTGTEFHPACGCASGVDTQITRVEA